MHPQPSTRFHFALHLGDEALALLGDNGDILHVRPFLWWLDGFGVFTMPQRAAVCSIILCIYLDDPEQFDYATEHNMVMVTRNRDDFLALNDEHFLAATPNCGLLIVPHTLPNNQPARIAHRLRAWNDANEAAPGSFGSYVVGFL